MTPIPLGPGIAPDVTIVNGWIYVAFGTTPDALQLVTLTREGRVVSARPLPHGFDQSFPRFSGAWLVYRQDEAHGYVATAYNILTGQTWTYGPAGATFGLTVSAALGLMAYEWKTPSTPWQISFGGLQDGARLETEIEGAPDGLDQILSHAAVTLRKDTRGDVPGLWSPVRAGALTVGELRDDPTRPNGGIGVQLPDDALRVALAATNTPDPRCATDGTVYAIVCWNPVRLLLATKAELRALPAVGIDKQDGPINTDDDKKESPVALSVPDQSGFVRSFLASRLRKLGSMDETRANSFAAVKACVIELRKTDARWGLLEKTAGDNVDGFAADIALYDLGDGTAQVVDIVSDAEGAGPQGKGDGTPSPGWSVKDIRPISQWRAPAGSSGPVGDTHLYIGGGNDTNLCDVCGKPRTDAVHAIPQAKVKHPYDGGEQDTGLCDICQQPPSAALHHTQIDPPKEDPVERHEFVGAAAAKFCSDCGQGREAAVHQKIVREPGPVNVDLTETNDLLRALLASNKTQEAKLDALREAVAKGTKDLTGDLMQALPGILARLLAGRKP